MPAGNWLVYGNALEQIHRGVLDIDSNAFRMVLVTSAHTPNQSTHTAWSDISSNEVAAAGGYSTHGRLVTVTVARSGLVVTVDCDNQSWTSSTITAKYAVLVRDANADNALAAGDIPLAYVNLETAGGSVSTTNGTFAVDINVGGIYTATAASS